MTEKESPEDMTQRTDSRTRRDLLRLTGGVSMLGLAGCAVIEWPPPERPAPPDDSYRDLPLPPGEEECVSIDGITRDPAEVLPKEEVGYQYHPNYWGPRNHVEMCANCTFFCPLVPPNTTGACAIVEDGVDSTDWCALYEPVERLVTE